MSQNELKRRIYSVDLLRGVVMIVMLLDHTRDYIQTGAMQSDPTNPANTTVPLFFTRWITHFCAPIFVFLAGTSIYLQRLNGKNNKELSWFLLTRGLWLIFLEFTVIRFAIVFNLDYTFFGMPQVIWVIGVSMIVMAALIYLPVWFSAIFGSVMILAHNLFDGFRVPPQTAFGGAPPPTFAQDVLIILHQQGVVPLFDGVSAFFVYPLIPWIGVMAVGFAFGSVYGWEPERRRKWLLTAGAVVIAVFILLRGINIYGDPSPWAWQSSPVFTALSFLNTTKYPPSLLFLLMTLGPALIVLGLTDKIDGKKLWQRIAITYGRVPMFYYILQWFVAHGAGVLLGYLAGVDVSYLFKSILEMAQTAPQNHGFPLWVVWVVWISGVALLYAPCYWWGNLKRRNKHWVLSYL
jgi:uncharacterized membrane protein